MTTALAKRDDAPAPVAAWVPSFVVPIEEMVKASNDMTEFQRRVMVKDVHYGAIPGTDKPTLLKPGAELLLSRMALRPSDPIILKETIDYGDCAPDGTIRREGLIRFTIQRNIYRYTGPTETDRMLVASGIGSCTSREKKYRWRNLQRVCPECGKPTIIKGKTEYGGGFLCWKKTGKSDGCGAKFGDNDPKIIDQHTGRVPNPDIADLENTILKIAAKRALIDATLLATGCSNVFSQDVGDTDDVDPRSDDIEGEFIEHRPTAPAAPANAAQQPAPARAAQSSAAPKPASDRETLMAAARAANGIKGSTMTGEQMKAVLTAISSTLGKQFSSLRDVTDHDLRAYVEGRTAAAVRPEEEVLYCPACGAQTSPNASAEPHAEGCPEAPISEPGERV